MHNCTRRSIESVQSVMISDKHCYELYGFDIMFDRHVSYRTCTNILRHQGTNRKPATTGDNHATNPQLHIYIYTRAHDPSTNAEIPTHPCTAI